jgi:hypothetical protein
MHPQLGGVVIAAEVVGHDMNLVATLRQRLRHPLDADGGTPAQGKRAGGDDGYA